jgi:anti-anti-sigma regulatory factor
MGIGIIAKTALKVNKSYGKLSVIITNDRILQLFSISEMSKIMHISNSIDESINFFNKKD